MSEPRHRLETGRLLVRRAAEEDADLFLALWTDPRIMASVGFPEGLRIDAEKMRDRIRLQGDGLLEVLLVVVEKATGKPIGECFMHGPDEAGVAGTDVKLLPAFQGKGYGTEVKRALLSFLFTTTDSIAVEATPNVGNEASIRMQEAVGGVRTGEGTFESPPGGRDVTHAVRHFVYRVTREAWKRRTAGSGGGEG